MPTNPRPNPYVGPRAFRTGEALYGRDREIQELLDLLIAERIVLLYSPSGAGKSSLVQAGLIPCLREEGFRVLPIARVSVQAKSRGADAQPGSAQAMSETPQAQVGAESPAGISQGDGYNRYLLSTLLSLEEEQTSEQQIPVEKLVGMTLDGYLASRPLQEGEPETEVLIFDQFEEIITLNPMDREVKSSFFAQVGSALRNRKRWALFSMREDYVAALDPYLRPIPTRLANTFRLDFLGVEAARQAIQSPAHEAGVEMLDLAAKKLVDDLRRVQVQRPDGVMEEQPGLYVEPVQLQVVCYRLWQNLTPDQSQISPQDLAAVENVDESLAEYYAERVTAIAAETALAPGKEVVHERAIRDWFDHHLITESGIRGQVLMGPEKSDGLDNRTIRRLENAHLVRAEKRRGVTWFELAHDRLLAPVRADNARWAAANLSLLQRQSTLWDNQERYDGLVLREGDLAEAERWAAEYPDELTETDHEFLKRCQEIRAREVEVRASAERQLKLEAAEKLAEVERQRAEAQQQRAEEQSRHASQLRRRAVALVIALGLALAMAAIAAFYWNQTSGARALAEKNASAAQAASTQAVAAQLNAEIASTKAISESNAAATARADAENQRGTAVAEGLVAQFQKGVAEKERQKAEDLRKVGLSNSLALISAEYLDRQADLALLLGIESYRWNEASWNAISALLHGLGRNISRKVERYGEPLPQQAEGIFDVAFSPNGQLLAWGSARGSVVLWDLKEGKEIQTWFASSGEPIYALTFNNSGSLLAYGDGGKIVIRNTSSGRIERLFTTAYNYLFDLAFSPNGKFLAINGQSRRIDLWELGNWTYQGSVAGDTGIAPCNLAWSPPGNYLAVACSGSAEKIRIWNPVTRELERSLDGLEGAVASMVWSPDGKLLVSGGDDEIGEKDKTLLVWDLNSRTATSLPGHQDRVRAVAFSPDGRVLATGGVDRTVILWDTNGFVPVDQLKEYGNQVTGLAFSPMGESLLASSSLDRTVKLYKLIPRESLYQILAFGKGQVKGLAYQSNPAGAALAGNVLLLGGRRDRITPQEVEIGQGSERLFPTAGGRFFASAALHPDGRHYALGGEDGSVQIRDIQTGEITREFEVSDKPLLSLAFDPGGERLAVALCKDEAKNDVPCGQNEIQFWDIQADPAIESGCISTGHTDSIRSLAFSPNGQLLASGSQDRNIYLYSGAFEGCPAQVETTLLASHTGGVTSLAFRLPAGDLLAAGGMDGKLAFWVVDDRLSVVDPILGNGGDLLSLAFSPDGKSLISGDEDGFILVWVTDVNSWVISACELAGRNLTQAEWQEFIAGDYRKTCEQWREGQ